MTVRLAKTGRIGAFLVFFFLLGAGVSAWWIGRLDGPAAVRDHLGAALTGLGLTVAVTLANVTLRWIRWHYLVRSVHVRLTAKDSLLIYLVTLPAILTPFYLGELLRVPLVGRKHPHHRGDIAYIWLLERVSDVLVLSAFAVVGSHFRIEAVAFALLWIVVLVVLRLRFRVKRQRRWPSLANLAVALGFSLLAWSLVGGALAGTLALMDSPVSLVEASSTFGYTTVIGGLTGVPVGIGIAGSLLVRQLTIQGTPLSTAILATLVLRLGTVWFVVAAGTITALSQWKRLLSRLQSQRTEAHFDDIGATYEDEIPEHIRQRLLVRKIRYMTETLPTTTAPASLHGLDIGCGHGWYACAMARAGYRMVGIDQSQVQIDMARRYTQEQGIACTFRQADAVTLPFEDDSFDFAYAINVLHHVVEAEAQLQALREIVRVLKPGGVFFLQEVNTKNPLFRFYLGYVFPLLRGIDEGNERWIRPDVLPDVPDAQWDHEKHYFTFLPDFLPGFLLKPLSGLERTLENSRLRQNSAHYVAKLIKPAGKP